MKKKWVFKNVLEEDIQNLSKELNVPSAIASILIQREIFNLDLAKNFFRPSLDNLYDPFLMKGMDIAANRIIDALNTNEKILVYGDYDVDGSTSVAMFYSFMKRIGANVQFYIPDRHIEGYGISKAGLDFAAKTEVSLIITLDCGTKDIANVALANSFGIETIICDHHEPGDLLPAAFAILNPKQIDCSYPFKELSGCGVGFKLMHALAYKLNIPLEEILIYLDFVAVSIACDIVPIVDENRVLMYHGLLKLGNNPSPGLKILLESSDAGEQVSVSDIVFGVGPRINAAGRIDHAHTAVNVLLAENLEDARIKIKTLEIFNTARKEIDREITAQALEMLSNNNNSQKSRTTVLYNPNWHKGVIGIVASRCIEHYYKPTIILTESQGKATGSARSVSGFNLYDAISECSDLLERYGGHAFAAGLTLKVENIPLLQQRFEEIVSSTISDECLLPPQIINASLCLENIDNRFYNILKKMTPFGPGNMQAVFIDKRVVALEYSILKEAHLKVFIKQKKGCFLEGIGFGLAHCESIISDGKPFEMAYSIEENNFGSRTGLSIRIRDIRECE